MAIRAISRGERHTRERGGGDPVGTVSCGVRGVGSGGTVTGQVWTTAEPPGRPRKPTYTRARQQAARPPPTTSPLNPEDDRT